MGPVTDFQIIGGKSVIVDILNFLDQSLGIQYHAVTDDADFILVKYARRNQVNLIFFAVDHNRMARIVASLITGHHFRRFRQEIGDFPFSFISPLRSNHYNG